MEEFGEGFLAQGFGGDFFRREARQSPGRARIVRDAGERRDPLRMKAGAAVGDEPRLSAEEMRDAGNVEHKPIGTIERRERGVARSPVAYPFEEQPFLGGRGLDDDEGRMAGARIRKREADSQAEPSRGGVDADEALGVIDPGDRRERGARVDPMETPRAVRRQTRQPEREKSPGRQRFPPRTATRAAPRASGRATGCRPVAAFAERG